MTLGLQVKKRVVQVISAMAHHGYLELEGGELLVLFLVQHCALPDTQRVQLQCLTRGFLCKLLPQNHFIHSHTTTASIIFTWPVDRDVSVLIILCVSSEARSPPIRRR